MSEKEEISMEDVFNILIASDIHLGFSERDGERGNDSFTTFEEILQLAVQHDVDFILLGGDLFHFHNPSQKCMNLCMSLIRQYCMGDRPVSVEFLSDQSINFKHCKNPVVNYEDPNLNVSIPIFSINGNHDDCSAVGVSAMDVLSSTGLVNYFGKIENFSNIELSPLLLRKGQSYLAIYGLSYMKDERLSRLIRDGKVRMLQSRQFKDQWFNLLVLHQNRVDHGKYTYIPEEALHNFLDLVFWGHEHECRIDPEKNTNQSFYVTQPGSSVATSLCAGEAVPKHVGLLQIHGKNQKITKLKLQTVRPFVMDTVVLSDHDIPRDLQKPSKEVEAFLTKKVKELIKKSRQLLTGHPKQPTKPLIRLRVEYKEEWQIFNTIMFGQQFHDDVMNFEDLILLRAERSKDEKKADTDLDVGVIEFILRQEELQTSHGMQMEQVIEKYFEDPANNAQLEVLSARGLGNALSKMLDYDDEESLHLIIKHQAKRVTDYLISVESNSETIERDMKTFQEQRYQNAEETEKKDLELLERSIKERGLEGKATQNGQNGMSSNGSDSDDDNDVSVIGTGTRGGRGSRGGSGRANASTFRPARGRGSRGPRARGGSDRGAASSQRNIQDFVGRSNSSRASKSNIVYVSDDSD